MIALSEELKSQGHECEMFFFERGTLEEYLPAGARVHFGDLADCMRLVEREGFDVVHANDASWHVGLGAVRKAGAKLVVTAHGIKGARTAPYGWNTGNCDAYVACSRWLARELQPDTDLPIQIVLNGIDTRKFTPSENRSLTESQPIVVWVGRGRSRFKRLDKLAGIAQALRDEGVRLWVVDSHGYDGVAQQNPDVANKLRPLAEFWGGVTPDRMPEIYREVAASGGCIISTSSSEGLPLTLLEAQASGCPAIGPQIRGVNECVDPEHGGVLYPFETPADELASCVLGMLRDKEKWLWRSEVCVKYAREHFSLQRMTSEYVRLYRESPYRPQGSVSARRNARRRLSPVFHWDEYLRNRWGAGKSQYESSEKLAAQGEWELASGAAREALATTPTLFLRPGRIAHLIKTHLRSRNH